MTLNFMGPDFLPSFAAAVCVEPRLSGPTKQEYSEKAAPLSSRGSVRAATGGWHRNRRAAGPGRRRIDLGAGFLDCASPLAL